MDPVDRAGGPGDPDAEGAPLRGHGVERAATEEPRREPRRFAVVE